MQRLVLKANLEDHYRPVIPAAILIDFWHRYVPWASNYAENHQ